MPLVVAGLPAGEYELKIDAFVQGRFTAAQLSAGVNLSANRRSPLYGPGRKVGELSARLQGATYRARELLRWKPPAWLKVPDLDRQKTAEFARAMPGFRKFDAQMAAASKPGPHQYRIVRTDR